MEKCLVFLIRGVQVEQMEIMLLLLGTRRNHHIIAVKVGEIFMCLLDTHDGFSLKLDWGGLTINMTRHDASFPKVMINDEVGSVVIVGFL